MPTYTIVSPDGRQRIVTADELRDISAGKTDTFPTEKPDVLSLAKGPEDVPQARSQEPQPTDGRTLIQDLLHHGVPMATQMGVTALGGPEAGIGLKMLLGAGGSVAGGLAGKGVDVAQGRPTSVDPLSMLMDAGIGAGTEGLVGGGGKLVRSLTGKTAATGARDAAEAAALQARRDAASKADEAISLKRTGAELDQTARRADIAKTSREAAEEAAKETEASGASAREKAQAAYNRQQALHVENAFEGVRDSEVERQVQATLGVPLQPATLTVEDLAKATSPVQHSVQRRVGSIFGGISNKFEQTLEPYKSLPVRPTIADTITVEKDALAAEERGGAISPAFSKYLDGLQERYGFRKTMTDMAESKGWLPVRQEGQSNVEGLLGVRKDLVKTMTQGKNPLDRRIAGRIVESIDEDLSKVVPKETQASLTTLRDEWRQASSTFSPTFRSRLFKATTPGEVADALYTGSTSGAPKAHRAAQVVRQMAKEAPDELPLLRSSFAERLSRGDTVGNVEKLDPSVFKALYAGTGFDNPKAWTEALRGQVTMKKVLDSPELTAKFQVGFQQGMKSLGKSKEAAALKAAEANLAKAPDVTTAVKNALAAEITPKQAGDIAVRGMPKGAEVAAGMPEPSSAGREAGMAAMRKPWGAGFQNYVQHRLLFHTVLSGALFSAQGIGGSHPLVWALPLAYLGTSKALGAVLSNPTVSKFYYNALVAKTPEQIGFWIGRLSSASLSQQLRQAGDEE